jgi:hypothetical protein
MSFTSPRRRVAERADHNGGLRRPIHARACWMLTITPQVQSRKTVTESRAGGHSSLRTRPPKKSATAITDRQSGGNSITPRARAAGRKLPEPREVSAVHI